MNVEREAWRPLFLREPVAQRGWNLVTRGVRAYLLRVAEDDGTLLKRCADPFELAKNLGVHGEETELVRGAVETLLHDGFLRWEGTTESPGWLGVDRLVTFFGQAEDDAPAEGDEMAASAHPGETLPERRRRLSRERKGRWKHRHQRSAERVPSVPESVPSSVPANGPERVPERLSPHSPLSDKEKTKQKDRLEERRPRVEGVPANGPERVPSVPDGVPGSVPNSVPRSVPRSGREGGAAPDPGTRGYLRIEPRLEHRKYAKEHGVNLDEILDRVRMDPRSEHLGTVELWGVISRALKKAAEKQKKLGGAA